MDNNKHKAGFVSIVGRPNVGKSTLMNSLVGENLSIISAKAQTTRHRIMGILTGKDFQVVYSDTPGMLEPKYALHKAMMNYVQVSLEDADLILLVVALEDKYEPIFDQFNKINTPILLVINKIDLAKGSQVLDKMTYWKEQLKVDKVMAVSATQGLGIEELFETILSFMPEHPAYYPEDNMSDRPEKFFASEIIREKIFLNYDQEVPYSTEVIIDSFKDEEKIVRIRALIYVERMSQKGIIIGKAGSSLKKVGIEARKDLEKFFNKQVHLETFVKVAENWRKQKNKLRQFGYLD
jgi:GTPase